MRFCQCVTVFVQNYRPRGSDVNTKGSDTLVGRLRKAGMYPAFIYLFVMSFKIFNFGQIKINILYIKKRPEFYYFTNVNGVDIST